MMAAIPSSMDPLLTYDEISSVELYIPGTGWVDEADDPCRGGNCDGTFPGYTLSASESASVIHCLRISSANVANSS